MIYKGEFDLSKRRVLFCNVAYMKYYIGITEDDFPINGGKYVNEEFDATEKYNFFEVIFMYTMMQVCRKLDVPMATAEVLLKHHILMDIKPKIASREN